MTELEVTRSDEQEIVAQRAQYLEAMVDESYRKTELTDVLDTPRSTVDRAVRQLEEEGLVKRVDSEFTTTLTGELAFERYAKYAEFSQNLFQAKEILNTIEEDVDFPAEFMQDTTVALAQAHMPEQGVLDVRGLVKESPYLHGLAPVALSAFTEWIQEMLMDGGHSFEIIASDEVFETLQTAMPGDFEMFQDHSEQFELFTSGEEMPYALWFVEPDGVEHVGITVYNGTGAVGSVVSSHPAAVEWGREQYNEFKSNSDQVF